MKTNFSRNIALDLRYGGQSAPYSPPATVYIALFTAAPTVAGGGTEVAGGSYARIAVTNNPANFPAAVAGAKSNANDIVFADATALWGTVTHVAIFDALVAGNMLDLQAMTTPRTIQNGDSFKISAGQLAFQES